MSRLHRQNGPSKSPKPGERIDFKFSNFQAIQVPREWDKLFVSVISVETGKTVAKSSKAPVRNGNCQWTETLSESVWVSQDDSIKALEECLFKFVVAMGSARSGILGEATVNMAGYMSSKASVPVFLPLKKCNHGTILQVKIHCLTPRTKLRDEESKDSSSHMEEQDADNQRMESKSNGSEDSFARNGGSPSSTDLGEVELQSRETSFSAAGSLRSFDSAGDSVGRGNFSSRNVSNGDKYNLIGRKGSNSSQHISPHNSCPAEDPSQSHHSSFNSRVTHSGNGTQNQWHESAQRSPRVIPSPSLMNAGSSKNFLEAAEDTIEELRAEAKMWERNARKLMLDLDILRKEFSDQSKKQADLDMELSAACTERDSLKKEVELLEQLRLMLEESMLEEKTREDLTFQSGGAALVQKELENEIKFQQETNDNLALQLKRSHESNIELVTVLQELEVTIEKQKVEIENLSALQSNFSDMEQSIEEKLEENKSLLLQLQQLQESENKLQANLQLLEKALEDKRNETCDDCSQNKQLLLDIETEYGCKISAREQEIANLETNLSEPLIVRQTDELGSANGKEVDLIREIEALKEKIQELENDCSELTNENLELLFKLKDSKDSCMQECTSFNCSSSEVPEKSFAISESDVSELKYEIQYLQEELKKTANKKHQLATFEASEVFADLVEQLQMAFYQVKQPWYNISSHEDHDMESDLVNLANLEITDLTAPKVWADSIVDSFIGLNKLLEVRILQCEEVLKCGELEMKERNEFITEVQKKLEDYVLKENNLCRTIQDLESSNIELEANFSGLEKELNEKISDIEKLKGNLFWKEEEIGFLRQRQGQLEAQISDFEKEKVQLEESMDDLQNDFMVLSSSVDSPVSASKILQSKCSELESQKRELELHLLDLEEEKVQLSEQMSGLEAQLRYLTDERESSRMELENSKSITSNLQHEIRRLEIEMETEKVDLKQNLQDMQNRRREALEECENLITQNQKLEASVESLVEESTTLEEANKLFRKQNVELHELCANLETKLRESQESSSDYSKRVETLETNLSAILEDLSLKEKSLTSEIDNLRQENRNHKEKLVLRETLFDKRYSEKTTEVENLQREIEQLTKQNFVLHELCMNLETKLRESRESSSDYSKRVETLETNLSAMLEDFALKEKSLSSEIDYLRQENRNQKEKLVQGETLFDKMYSEKTMEVENLQRVIEQLTKQISEIDDEREKIASDALHDISILHASKEKLEYALREVQSRVKLTENELDTVRSESELKVQHLMAELSASRQKHQSLVANHEKTLKSLGSNRSSEEKLKTALNDLELKFTVTEYEHLQLIEETAKLKVQLQKVEHFQDDTLALRSELHTFKSENEKLKSSLRSLSRDSEELKAEKIVFLEKISSLQSAISEFEECKRKKVTLEERLKLMEGDLSTREAVDAELKNELSKITKANKRFEWRIQQLEEEKGECLKKSQSLEEQLKIVEEEKKSRNQSRSKKGDNKFDFHDENPQDSGVEHVSKVQLLQNELAQALEANNKYKIQLQRLLSEGKNNHVAGLGKSTAEGDVVPKESYQRTKSSLETELRDLSERYLQMSLKYAEVEAEREDLVMKLKAANTGKKWFS